MRHPNLPALLSASSTDVAIDVTPEVAQGDESPPGLSIAQIVSIVWAYRIVSAVIACAIFAAGVVVTKLLPKTYEATATLIVNSSISDPLAGKEVELGILAGFIPTETQLIETPEVLFPVIDELKLTGQKEFAAGCRGTGLVLKDCVESHLTRHLLIEGGAQGSLLINVTAAAHDPVLAASIANAVAEAYLASERKRLEEPDVQRAERYAQELAELEAKVRSAQAQMADFRQRTGVVDLTAQTTVEEDILAGLKRKLDDAESARRLAEVKAASDPALSPEAMGSASVQALKTQLAAQQSQLAELTPTLGVNHPKIKELSAQIKATEAQIASAMATLRRSDTADIASAEELEQKLRKAIDQQNQKVLAVRKLRDEGNQYILALDSAQAVYKRALDGYDQIMFASSGKYSYASLVTHALPPQTSSRPNKPKLAMLAAIMGLGCGVGGPFVYELLLNRRIRCHDDLEAALGLRLLVDFGTTRLSDNAA